MRYFGLCLLAIAALLATRVPVMAQHAAAYVVKPGHVGLEFGVYAASHYHDPGPQVFFVLEVGGHSQIAPAIIHGPAPHVYKKQLERHRKLHRKLAKLERKREREAFRRHQRAHRRALERHLAFERELRKAERRAIKRARKLERDFQ